MTDPASANIAVRVMERIWETTGEQVVDFRDGPGAGGGGRPARMESLFSMLRKGKIDILISPVRLLPVDFPEGTFLAAVLPRGNPFNCLISSEELILEEQPGDAPIVVPDRACKGQLLYFRPDLLIVEMDEGLPRLASRMEKGEIGGFVSSAAEIEAMCCQDQVVEVLTSSICMPPAGQGAVGLVTRRDDRETKSLVDQMNHLPSRSEVELERKFLDNLPGRGRGAAVALGTVEEDAFNISAVITAEDGSEKISASMEGPRGSEAQVAEKLASEMLESGAGVLIG